MNGSDDTTTVGVNDPHAYAEDGEAKWKLLVYEIADAAEHRGATDQTVLIDLHVRCSEKPGLSTLWTHDMKSMAHWLRRDVKLVLKERGL